MFYFPLLKVFFLGNIFLVHSICFPPSFEEHETSTGSKQPTLVYHPKFDWWFFGQILNLLLADENSPFPLICEREAWIIFFDDIMIKFA